MADLIEVVEQDGRWSALPLAALADRAARAALEAAGLAPEGYAIALLACSDARIAELNRDWRGKEGPTNVLSWPAHDLAPEAPGEEPFLPPEPEGGRPESLGDIALAWETTMREAAEQGLPPADHATHLILHATLHLLGYDHESEADATLMEGCESRMLARMGLHDPYSQPVAAEASQIRQEP